MPKVSEVHIIALYLYLVHSFAIIITHLSGVMEMLTVELAKS